MSRLRREGFKALLAEQLGSLKPQRGGLSWVMELGSAASAQAELAATVRENENASTGYSPFSVGAIPGARGFHSAGGGFVGDNVVFAARPFLDLVGNGWSAGIANRRRRPR